MRIGILGGTFDPIHIAHLIIAEEARVRLGLDQVVFMPAGEPWLKAEHPVTPGVLRLRMVRLAIVSNPSFQASAVEIERPGPTYTVDTLETLREEWGPEAETHFILGMDILEDLPRWKAPERLMELCTLVAFVRPEHSRSALGALETRLPGIREKVQVLNGPTIAVSGTEIRRRVAQGISIRYLVPDKVEQFIAEHGLYRSSCGYQQGTGSERRLP